MTRDWEQCLDRFEDHLAAQRVALAEGRPEQLGAFRPPAALGPLPAELAERARGLATVVGSLEDELAAALAATARQLQLLAVMNRAEKATASFLDDRG